MLGVESNRRLRSGRSLTDNRLPFPEAVANMPELTYLNVASNLFSGEVSSDFCSGDQKLGTLILNPSGTTGSNDNDITCVASCLLNDPSLVIIAGTVTACLELSSAPTSAPTISTNQLLQKVRDRLANASLTMITVFVVFGAFSTGAVVYWIRTRNDRAAANSASALLAGNFLRSDKKHLLLSDSGSSMSSHSSRSLQSLQSSQSAQSALRHPANTGGGALTWDRMFHVNSADSSHSDSSRGLQLIGNRIRGADMSVLQPTDDLSDISSDYEVLA